MSLSLNLFSVLKVKDLKNDIGARHEVTSYSVYLHSATHHIYKKSYGVEDDRGIRLAVTSSWPQGAPEGWIPAMPSAKSIRWTVTAVRRVRSLVSYATYM